MAVRCREAQVQALEAEKALEQSNEDSYDMPCDDEDRGKELNAKVNEVEPEVQEVSNVNKVNVNEVNENMVNVNEVSGESVMNEDSGKVCDAKEEMRKGKPPEVLQKFDFTAKVHMEGFGMKEVTNSEEVKNSQEDKEVERLPPSKEVKGIDDLTAKTKEESRHARWDPGELVDAKAQIEMFNVKVEVMPSGDVNAKALFEVMLLFYFMRLYISEVLVP